MSGIGSALAVFDPDPIETRLFKTALCPPDVAFAELAAWETDGSLDLVAYLAGPGKWMRGQQPLIYANVSEPLAKTPLACRPYLKTATVRERKRYEVYRTCLSDALAVLNGAERHYCVVKAAAVANTVYASPHLRHCHDLDVVVRAVDQAKFVAAFQDAGFTSVTTAGAPGFSARMDHPTGLPVLLHSQPVEGDPRFDADWMLDGASPIETEAGRMIVPMRARRILHSWMHRFGCDRYQRHAWVPDTVLDLRAASAADIDVLNQSLRDQLILPEALASARYLRNNFGPIPQLDAVTWPDQTLRGATTSMQRARFQARARTQKVEGEFRAQLDLRTRLALRYDWLLPPPARFELPPSVSAGTLWRHRLRRALRGVRRRLA